MKLTVQCDSDNDLVYLAFTTRALAPGSVRRTVRVTDDIAIDFGSRGALMGMEIMNASKVFGRRSSDVTIDELIGVKEAASLCGVQRSNFVRDYAGRSDFPAPVAELATGRIWLRSQVVAYLAKATHRRRQTATRKSA